MAEQFIINGGKHLKGTIEARGAKNACFPILAATLLTEKECVIGNIPLIEDVFLLIEILKSLGKEVEWVKKRTLRIRQKSRLDAKKIDQKLISKLRGSVLLLGPLLARCGKVKFAQPGGCVIGARPISTHLDVLSQLGVDIGEEVTEKAEYFSFEFKNKPADEIILNEFSVTATENALLFASALPKKTIIKAADCDYSTQELAKFLNKMGAKIKMFGSHNFSVIGKKVLSGAKHKILNDPIEAGTFILMAAATRSDIIVKNVEISYLEFPLKRLRDFGLPIEIIGKNKVRIKPWANFKMEKIQAMPYPGIPTDLLPLFGVLATQTEGTTLLHDPLYDGRLRYLNELNKMGAQIIFADPHRAIINGPTVLRGVTVESPDLRGGASLIVGALIAKGETVINNIYQIDRGYERIEERLQKLGVDIRRVKSD
ncbi:MAG: UDP-N-acetylglucosamine 1-carboxyvinyltransferase [Candidatus Parcubacteria bacterium]|nr:UDP-N-acetylglucosamine 1-carboxyvinyltransferase [Candidatus Parcubacteria bacterium]